MSARYIEERQLSQVEPSDPWAPGGWGTLPDRQPFMPQYAVPAEQDQPESMPSAMPLAAEKVPLPALIVRLANGWTAVVEHPDQEREVIGKGGQGKVYAAHVYDEHDNPRGKHALKQAKLTTRATADHNASRGPGEPAGFGPAMDRAETNLVRETAIMQHVHLQGMKRRSRAGVPWTVTHGQDNNWEYMLQAMVPGETLRTHLDSGARLPTLTIMRDLLETVTDMEDTSPRSNGSDSDISRYGGLVYLDLKPDNVIYDPETGDTHLVDGGVAHGRLEEDHNPDSAVGTALWLAPEQCEGDKQTLQTNQYQLALIWLELRTGGGYSKMRNEMNQTRSPITYAYQTVHNLHWDGINKLMLDHDIPYEEQRIMLRALQTDPAQRWESSGAMLDALVAYMESQMLRMPRTLRVPRLQRIRLVEIETPDMMTQPLESVRRRADLALVH